jgi:glc operon protein GlcG
VAEESSDGVTRRQAMGRGTAIAVGAAAGAAVATAPAAAAGRRHGGPGDSLSVLSVSLEQAERVIEAARRRAEQLGVAMYIVVVDSSGVEKASRRMDGNGQASPTLAPLKAQTANGFRTATHTLAEANAGDPARIASIASAPGLTPLGGGVPLRDGDTVIGAIGVGGGSAAQDVEVAEAGAAALS